GDYIEFNFHSAALFRGANDGTRRRKSGKPQRIILLHRRICAPHLTLRYFFKFSERKICANSRACAVIELMRTKICVGQRNSPLVLSLKPVVAKLAFIGNSPN